MWRSCCGVDSFGKGFRKRESRDLCNKVTRAPVLHPPVGPARYLSPALHWMPSMTILWKVSLAHTSSRCPMALLVDPALAHRAGPDHRVVGHVVHLRLSRPGRTRVQARDDVTVGVLFLKEVPLVVHLPAVGRDAGCRGVLAIDQSNVADELPAVSLELAADPVRCSRSPSRQEGRDRRS